jgi:nucleotide-binding universal stress UspA family protein
MYKKILVGLDGSAGAYKALAAALELAKLGRAEVWTISVEQLPHFAQTVAETLEEKATANHKFGQVVDQARRLAEEAGVDLRCHVTPGHEVGTMVEFVKANGFDLLAIGFMGHTALYNRIMGSTCQSLVRMAPCAVLVVK